MDTIEEFTPLLSKVNEAIKNGDDLDRLQKSGHTLFHDAAIYNDMAAYNALREAEANISTKTSYNQGTPLHLAALYNSIEVANALVEDGADVKAIDLDARTPLHITANCGHDKISKVLMEAGADPSKENNFGFIPLEMEFIQKIKIDLDRKQQLEGLKELTTTRKKRRNSNDFIGVPNPKKRIRRSNSF